MFSKISSMLTLYLYYVFWLSTIIIHRNIWSYFSLILYILAFVVGIAAAVFFPEYAFLYRFGLTIIQGVIIIGCVLLTLVLAKILT